MSQMDVIGSSAVSAIPPEVPEAHRPGMDLATARRAALSQLRVRLRTEPNLIASLWTELASPDRIIQPDLTLFYGTLSYAGRTYTILEYVSGETLEELVRRADPGEVESATPLFCRVLDAFEESDKKTQSQGLPSSFADSGVVLTDFGVCRISCETWGRSYGTLLITPAGISPEEIIREDQTSRQHILSLLLAACQSLLGQAPPCVEAAPGILKDIFIAPVAGRPKVSDLAPGEPSAARKTRRFRIPSALIALATAVLVLAVLFVGARLMSRIVPKQSAIALPPSPALNVEVQQSPKKPDAASSTTRQRVSSPRQDRRPSNDSLPVGPSLMRGAQYQQVASPVRGSS
jgi:serine/threonine protein kinase